MSDTHWGRVSDHPEGVLLLFIAGEATPAQRATVTEHLATCAKCRASLRELRETCLELKAQPMESFSELAWERAALVGRCRYRTWGCLKKVRHITGWLVFQASRESHLPVRRELQCLGHARTARSNALEMWR